MNHNAVSVECYSALFRLNTVSIKCGWLINKFCFCINCRLLSIVLAILALQLASPYSNGVSGEVCEYLNGTVNTTVIDMQRQCNENGTQIQVLQFAESTFTKIPPVFAAFPSLTVLEVCGVGLTVIDNTTFVNGGNLTTLQLYNNSIDQIDSYVFRRLINLISLNLESNRINNIDEHAFNGLHQLTTLDLSLNQISALVEDVFSPLVQLQTLRLTGNRVEIISDSTFKANQKLRTLYLDTNRITNIDNAAFKGLKALRTIVLSYNNVPNTDFLRITSNIHTVQICNASLISLFIPRTTQTLTAKMNQIVNVTFGDDPQIKALYLEGNRIQRIEDFEALTKLEILDVANNSITLVDFGKLAKLTALKQLKLVGNNMTAINATGVTQILPKLNVIELPISKWDKNRTSAIMAEFTEQKVYVMNDYGKIVNMAVSRVDESKKIPLLLDQQPMADSPAKKQPQAVPSNQELHGKITKLEQTKDHLMSEVGYLKSVVSCFIVLFAVIILVKVAVVIKRRYFGDVVIPNPLQSRRARSSDSFNPIFEDRL